MTDLSVTNRGSGWSCKFRRRLAAESYWPNRFVSLFPTLYLFSSKLSLNS